MSSLKLIRLMDSPSSVAATLRPEVRQKLEIEALSKSKPIIRVAQEYQVSRKFVRLQSDKAKAALSKSFEPTPPDEQVLFHLPVTKSWLFQLILSLVLICHSSLRGVVELLRDVFHLRISPRTMRNRLEAATQRARKINAERRCCRSKRKFAVMQPSLKTAQAQPRSMKQQYRVRTGVSTIWP